MYGEPKCRGILVVVLMIALAAAWIPVYGTSYAAEPQSGLSIGTHTAYICGYPDGTVKPAAAITREETAVIFYRLMTEEDRNAYASSGRTFPDVDLERWSGNEISVLYRAGVITGNPDGSFQPDKPVTRAEFAAIAARFDKLGDVTDETEDGTVNKMEDVSDNKPETRSDIQFHDVGNHWAKQYINSSVDRGWIRAFGDGTFRPDSNVIRCEAMMLINDVLDRRVNTAGLCRNAKQWPDNPSDKWYYEIVLEAACTHDYERADRPKSTEKWANIRVNPVW